MATQWVLVVRVSPEDSVVNKADIKYLRVIISA